MDKFDKALDRVARTAEKLGYTEAINDLEKYLTRTKSGNIAPLLTEMLKRLNERFSDVDN